MSGIRLGVKNFPYMHNMILSTAKIKSWTFYFSMLATLKSATLL